MKKILLFLMLITCSSVFGADNSDIIWTWGNGKFVASIFSFMYFLLNVDTLNIIIKFSGVIGITVVFFRELAKGSSFQPSALALKMAFFFFITQGTAELFLTVKQDAAHRVYILSANELATPAWQKCRPVNGDDECYAPTGVKLLVSSLTNMERASIGMMESAMMDANALSYSFSRMGLGFGFTFYDQIAKTKGDPFTYNTFMEFYENCIIYDLADGTKSVDGLYKSKDLASYTLSPNSRLTNVYSSTNPNGILHTCYEVSSATLWGNINCDKTAKQLQAKASGSSASETTTGDICLAAENFGKLMFNTAKDAGQQIEQRTIMNLTNEAIVNSAIASGIDPSVLAYGTTMADREQTSKWMVMGVMAKEWIPAMRGIMQGIAIGIIWILAVLSIMTASPVQYLGTAVGFQVTLIVWSILLALINYATIDNMAGQLPNIFVTDLGVGDQMTLWSQPTFDEQNQKAMAFLGYMAVSSYGIAAGLVKIGGNALSGSFSGMVGALSVGMGTSANAAKGHMDHGLSKVDSGGAQHHNSTTGGIDRLNADGSSSHENLTGLQGSKTVDQSGTLKTSTSINGKSASNIKTSAGNEATITGDGQVNNVAIKNGVAGSLGQQAVASATNKTMRAQSDVQNAQQTLQNAEQSQITTATNAIKGAASSEGTDTVVAQQGAEKRAFSKTLDEMVTNKEINSTQKEKAIQKFIGEQASAKVSIDSGKTIGGQALAMATGVTASAEISGNAGWQGSDVDKDSHQKALEKSFTEKFSKNYATEASKTVSNSTKMDQSLKDEFTSSLNKAHSSTQSASKSHTKALQIADSASKEEAYVRSNSAMIGQDMTHKYMQNVYDKAGGGESGEKAVTTELVRFEDARYAHNSLKEFMSEVKDTTNVDTKINATQTAIDVTHGSLSPVEKQDKKENDNRVVEQNWINEGEVKVQNQNNHQPFNKEDKPSSTAIDQQKSKNPAKGREER